MRNYMIHCGDHTFELSGRRLSVDGSTHLLTTKELQLLKHLIGHIGQPVSRQNLLSQVWGYSAQSETRTVDTCVRRLRLKIEETPHQPIFLQTVRGVGYRLAGELGSSQPQGSPSSLTSHHLFEPDTLFVGRQSERASLHDVFEMGWRVCTITGPPGIGKTRIAQHFGHEILKTPINGIHTVVYCDASHANTPQEFTQALLQSLDFAADADLKARLKTINGTLLIIDNIEQIVSAAKKLIPIWLSWGKENRFLLTSREGLAIESEHSLRLAPLPTSEAVTLLACRLGLSTSQVQQQKPELTRLCQSLDCLPLALELEAATPSLPLTPTETAPPRRAPDFLLQSIKRSIDALSPYERQLIIHTVVFVGGFTLDAAEKILPAPPDPENDSIGRGLQSLVDKCLLQTLVPTGAGLTPRLSILYGIRQYLLPKYRASKLAQGTEERRLAYYLRSTSFLEAASPPISSDHLRILQEEEHNIRDVVKQRLLSFQSESLTLLERLWLLYDVRDATSEFLILFDKTVKWEELHLQDVNAARLLKANIFRSMRDATTALEILKTIDPDTLDSFPRKINYLLTQSNVHQAISELDKAEIHTKSALILSQNNQLIQQEARAFSYLGNIEHRRMNWLNSRQYYHQSISLFRRANNPLAVDMMEATLAKSYILDKRSADAIPILQNVIKRFEYSGRHLNAMISRCDLGSVFFKLDQLNDAHAIWKESLDLAINKGPLKLELHLRLNVGIVLFVKDQLDDSAQLQIENIERARLLAATDISVLSCLFASMALIELGNLPQAKSILDYAPKNLASFTETDQTYLRRLTLLLEIFCQPIPATISTGKKQPFGPFADLLGLGKTPWNTSELHRTMAKLLKIMLNRGRVPGLRMATWTQP